MGRLHDIFSAYAASSAARFHMPGHKGRGGFFELSSCDDLTELPFTDNLNDPSPGGPIRELEARVARCVARGGAGALISCSGTTLLVQTVIAHMAMIWPAGEKYLLCGRTCHYSVINAMALCGVEPLWVTDWENPDFDGAFRTVQNGKIIGAFVTSPDYYGRMADVARISRLCKAHGIALAVDNAHGAHLAFHGGGSLHPINLGAAYSVDSAHKTLPVMGGAAYLLYAERSREDGLRAAARLFATSSPSFAILNSLDRTFDRIEAAGGALHAELLGRVEKFKGIARAAGFKFDDRGLRDPYRIVLHTPDIGYTGQELYDALMERGVCCEFHDGVDVVLIPSVANTSGDFGKLEAAVGSLTRKEPYTVAPPVEPPLPERAMPLREAAFAPCEAVTPKDSVGRICARSVYAYPPGTPVLVPGERIAPEQAAFFEGKHERIYVVKE